MPLSKKRSNGITDSDRVTNTKQKENKKVIREILEQYGFPLVGFLNVTDASFDDWITPWLEKNFHADMAWMEKHGEIRSHPGKIFPESKSIIVIGLPYYTSPPATWTKENPISCFAWGEDYHVIIKKKMKAAINELSKVFPDLQARGFVDSAPVPEKILGARAGLGWIGKNSLLINEKYGSFFFLGEIFTNLTLESDNPVGEHCGSCNKCVEWCPNHAIQSVGALQGMVDSNKCISWLTIEKKESFHENEESLIQYQLFGCDICQQICPWNQKLDPQNESPFVCAPKWTNLKVSDYLKMTEEQFAVLKQKSPLKRAGLSGLQRNARIVLKNQNKKD